VFAHSQGERFAVSEYELSSRHDLRPLVLKTILTYLELDGFLEQGTPFYAGYSVHPTSGEWDDVYAIFDPDRADFLRRVLASGKEGHSGPVNRTRTQNGRNQKRHARPLPTLAAAPDLAICRRSRVGDDRACPCVTLRAFNGKEGVDGSSLSEGFDETPANRRLVANARLVGGLSPPTPGRQSWPPIRMWVKPSVTTARTYTHVVVDERELAYAELLV
jgi:hypothetical protein